MEKRLIRHGEESCLVCWSLATTCLSRVISSTLSVGSNKATRDHKCARISFVLGTAVCALPWEVILAHIEIDMMAGWTGYVPLGWHEYPRGVSKTSTGPDAPVCHYLSSRGVFANAKRSVTTQSNIRLVLPAVKTLSLIDDFQTETMNWEAVGWNESPPGQ